VRGIAARIHYFYLDDHIQELRRSHDQLRAALILAGRHIRKLSFGKRNDPVLTLLRRTLKEARSVAKQHTPPRLGSKG